MASAEEVVVGAATLVEASIVVLARQGGDGHRDLHHVLDACGARVAPLEEHHVHEAVEAWRRLGKGRHPAGLNLGDCSSYAVAQAADAPLLYKSDDFPLTDVRSALPHS